jgi:hypothetical protein
VYDRPIEPKELIAPVWPAMPPASHRLIREPQGAPVMVLDLASAAAADLEVPLPCAIDRVVGDSLSLFGAVHALVVRLRGEGDGCVAPRGPALPR